MKTFSLGFYTNERLGEIGVIIHKDVDNMEMVVGHIWTRMVADFIVSILLIVPLFLLDPIMGALMLSTLPAALLPTIGCGDLESCDAEECSLG